MSNSDGQFTDAQVPDALLTEILGLMETNPEKALLRLDILRNQFAKDARLHFMTGSVLAGLERYSEARMAMQASIDIAPEYSLARFQLGFLVLTSGEPAMAETIWRPLLDLSLENPLRLFVQGLTAMVADNFGDAIGLIEAGVARNQTLGPLNRNMNLLVNEMRRKRPPEEAGGVESGAHFLLKQYSIKDTRH